MLQNYLTIAFRNLIRQRGFSLINLLGLSIGLTATFFIALWVQQEKSYDQFHTRKANMYRIISHLDFGEGEIASWFTAPLALKEALPANIPEVQKSCFIGWQQELLLSWEERSFEGNGFHASENFFEVFSFPLLMGDASTALENPNSIVIGESLAKKLFGDAWLEEAMGKTLTLNQAEVVIVTGIAAEVPSNSSIQFGYVMSVEKLLVGSPWQLDWGNFNFNGYVVLAPETNMVALRLKIDDLVAEQRGEGGTSFELQPLTKMHLYGDFKNGQNVGGRITYVRIFSIAAMFLLLMACINFMNLATARAGQRAMEIGIRKTVGGTRASLMTQFFGESLFMALLAMVVAICLTALLLPAFNALTDKALSLPYADGQSWLWVLGITVLTALLAGTYPALLLSSFSVVSVLKGRLSLGAGNVMLRRGLVVFQFGLSIFLIIATLVIFRQLNYLQTKNLGLDKAHVLSFRLPDFSESRMKQLRERLSSEQGILSITASDQDPLVVANSTNSIDWDGKPEEMKPMIHGMRVGYDFVETFRPTLLAGRDFDRSFGLDTANYVVNEEMAELAGWLPAEEAIGQNFSLWETKGKIIGVMKNFHIASMYIPIEPLVLTLDPGSTPEVFIRFSPARMSESLVRLEQVFTEISPGYPFQYEFVDQRFAQIYSSEQMMGKLAATAAFLGIFIACLGLLGLAAFSIEQRTKEIGIRKVLGASVNELVLMLGKEFSWLVVAAFAIAAPVAAYALDRWLSEFSYYQEMESWVFVLSGILAMVVAWLTIGWQAISKARMDPATSLRAE
jgi:hypothetical protein